MQICVIGAGAAGLTTAKHLLEEGFDVEILEKRDGLGGLWYFDPKQSSVSKGTHATSSKTFLQFSDFPMKKEAPEFPHHTYYVDYLKDYSETYKILPLIKYNHEVKNVKKSDSGWDIEISDGQNTYTKTFDGVAICSGLHHVPLIPKTPGSENFNGLITHSSLLKNTEELRGKRVLVVGGGESGADLVHELSSQEDSKVYLSLRRGMCIARERGTGGLPGSFDSTRAKTWLPKEFLHDYNVSCRLPDRYSAFKTVYTLVGLPLFFMMLTISWKKATSFLGSLFNWKTWAALFKKELRHGPADGVALSKACQELCDDIPESEAEVAEKAWRLKFIFDWYSGSMHNSQPATKRLEFLQDIVMGKAKVMPGIARYNGGSEVEFEDGSKLELDAVVLCTGFESTLPFFEVQKIDGRELYKNVFLPGTSMLGFVGFARPNSGALTPIAEMQARLLSGVFSGRINLPDMEKMKKAVEADAQRYNKDRKVYSARLTSQVDYHFYMEELAGLVGCRPQLWRLIGKPKMLFIFLFGPMACYQYRLNGAGANPQVVMDIVDRMPTLPMERVLLHATLLIMKPSFILLEKLGLKRFRPQF